MVSNNYSIMCCRNAVTTLDTQFQSWQAPKRGRVLIKQHDLVYEG